MIPDLDGTFYDWIPVWSEEKGDLLNIFLDCSELPDYGFKHLRSNNYKYRWIGEDQPRTMDLTELAKAIAMKYGEKIGRHADEVE